MSLERFEELANLPSTFPTSSEAGAIDIDGKFAVVVDDIMPEELLGRIIALAEEQEFSAALLNVGDGHQEKGVLNESSRKSQRSVIDSDSLAAEIFETLQPVLPASSKVPGPRFNNSKGSNKDKGVSSASASAALGNGGNGNDEKRGEWVPVAVTACLRVLKYEEGDKFEVHQDGSYVIEAGGGSSTTTNSSDLPQSPLQSAEAAAAAATRGQERRSFLTLQIYLNDGGGRDFTGGGTRFMSEVAAAAAASGDSGGDGNKERKSKSKQKQKQKKPPKGPPAAAASVDSADTSGAHSVQQHQVAAAAASPPSSPSSTSSSFVVRDVVPRRGRVLLFQHNIWHEGELLTAGTKMVLRSEILYERQAAEVVPS